VNSTTTTNELLAN